MNVDASGIVVIVSFGLSAWAMYGFGFRARSVPVAVALIGVPVLVWIACRTWLYEASERAGYSPLLGAMPAVAAYAAMLWIAFRGIGGATYRVGHTHASFGRELAVADQSVLRAFQEPPPIEANGMIDAARLHARLEMALAEFRALDPPPGPWKRLVEERAGLHAAHIAVLTSSVPVGPDVFLPLEDRSREWASQVKALIRHDEGRPA